MCFYEYSSTTFGQTCIHIVCVWVVYFVREITELLRVFLNVVIGNVADIQLVLIGWSASNMIIWILTLAADNLEDHSWIGLIHYSKES